MSKKKILEHEIEVHGVHLGTHRGCAHYHSALDVIAIKFKCCQKYYACYFCHEELEDHPPKRWEKEEFECRAILCRQCGHELSIQEYLSCKNTCPHCRVQFNPGCKSHWNLYFSDL
jgi:uncharacterized CHY-type Zn-finger protein